MKRPARDELLVFTDPGQLRAWLAAHHATEHEAWIGLYKKGVPKPGISYAAAVDEALCFGWIDGITYRIDDELQAIRFSPRRRRSTWSTTNVRRMGELIEAGRAHAAGIAAFAARGEARIGLYSYENRPQELPAPFLARLRANEAAWAWWQTQPPGYRRTATWWVVSARREETRERRFAELLADAAAGRRIRPLRPRDGT